MALRIRDARAEQLAREVAAETGENLTAGELSPFMGSMLAVRPFGGDEV